MARWTEKDLIALRKRQRAEAMGPPPRPVKRKKPLGEPPLSAEAAYLTYKVKFAFAIQANREADVAWATYEAIVETERKAAEGYGDG